MADVLRRESLKIQKLFFLALALFLLTAPSAGAQDALGTFAFVFLNDKLDLTRNYGNQLVTEDPMGNSLTVSRPSKCVFEARFKQTGRLKGRWDFNKAFFSEMTIVGDRAEIPGEKGLRYIVLDECGRKEYRRECSKKTSELDIASIFGLTERRVEALQYFVTNFCSGTERKLGF